MKHTDPFTLLLTSASQPPFFVDKIVLGPMDGWGFTVNNQPGKLYNIIVP